MTFDNKTILVSVIIPVYNAEKYLRQCIDSVLEQTYKHFEILLVDDGSTDSSGEICDEYARFHSNVTTIHQKNAKQYVARRAGFMAAHGEYVMHIDADDWVEPNMMETLLSKALECDADVVTSAIILERYGQRDVIHDVVPDNVYRDDGIRYLCSRMVVHGASLDREIEPHLATKLIKSSILNGVYKIIGDDAGTVNGEDGLVCYGAIALSDTVIVTLGEYYHYRNNGESITHQINKNYFGEMVTMLKKMNALFEHSRYADVLDKQIKGYAIRLMYEGCCMDQLLSPELSMPLYDLPQEFMGIKGKIVLYGAGKVGLSYFKQISNMEDVELVAWVDKNKRGYICGQKIVGIDDALTRGYDKVLIAIKNEDSAASIRKNLQEQHGVKTEKIIWGKPTYAY